MDDYGDEFRAYVKGNYIILKHIYLKKTFAIKADYSYNAFRLYRLLAEGGVAKIKALV